MLVSTESGSSKSNLPLDYKRYTRKNMDKVPFSKWVRDPQKLKSFVVFRDYQFLSAERLVIDTLKDSHRLGAVVRNYTECTGAKQTRNLADLFFRRSDMGWDIDHSRIKLEPVAKIMAEVLGWDGTQLQEQLCNYHRFVEENFPPHPAP